MLYAHEDGSHTAQYCQRQTGTAVTMPDFTTRGRQGSPAFIPNSPGKHSRRTAHCSSALFGRRKAERQGKTIGRLYSSGGSACCRQANPGIGHPPVLPGQCFLSGKTERRGCAQFSGTATEEGGKLSLQTARLRGRHK